MKKILLLLVTGIIFFQCQAESTTAKADTTVPRILIINAFDASAMKARKNKKELFAELADSLKHYLSSEMGRYTAFETVVAKELMNDTTGNTLNSLLQQYNCTSAVVITNLNIYFEQTFAGMIKGNDGTDTRKALYDICTNVQYKYYKNANTTEVLEKNHCSFFTNRFILSGALAAGPDIVGKSKHAFIAIRQNAAVVADEIIYLLKKEGSQ